jgi:hypothetical protein
LSEPPDCQDPSIYEGQECATSADCCGLPCTPNSSGEDAPLVCGGAQCVDSGGVCTTASDCCSGLACELEPGSTSGVCSTDSGCAQYGQTCETAEDCCNQVPCTGGLCEVIVD